MKEKKIQDNDKIEDSSQIKDKNISIKSKKQATIALIVMFLLFLIIMASAYSLYAWAKYASGNQGNATANVAKWHFELRDGVARTTDIIDFPVTRTDTNTSVSADTIAPGTYGCIPITVDTTGTEVHMKYDIQITLQNYPTNMVFYNNADKNKKHIITPEISGTGEPGSPRTATITITKYIDKSEHSTNGVHEHTIYWDWPYETTTGEGIDSNDQVDSLDMNKQITMAITATGTQVKEILPDVDEPVTGLYARLYDNNTLVLSSKSNMEYDGTLTETYRDNNNENIYNRQINVSPVWYSDRSKITKVIIQDRITPRSTYKWFEGFSSLSNIDLTNLDTRYAENMGFMFFSCSGLTILDLSNFDTSSATEMGSMFQSCSGLTSLDVSNFDTSSVTSMGCMFYGCSGLTSLDLSSFDTSSLTNMSEMFFKCTSLITLDLSSFNTSLVTNMSQTFISCSNLTTIYASTSFDTSSVTNSYRMFRKCNSLVGGNGTAFNSSIIDKSYARIDTPETPGYFTLKTN